MDEYREKSLQTGGELMSKVFLQLKNVNNNSQEASFRELNGCHAMKPSPESRAEHQKYFQDYASVEAVVEENGTTENDNMTTGRPQNIPVALSNSSSTSNSTDNLSLTDEVILLPGQQFSDEEISVNSDDCVYAYRGADFDALEYRNNNVDDETDFLEMDFEPDPASEVDNTNECRSLTYDHDLSAADEIILPLAPQHDDPILKTTSNSLPHQLQISEDQLCPAARHQNNDISDENEGERCRLTGAKPKKQQADRSASAGKILQSQQKISKGDENELVIADAGFFNGNGDQDEQCIDCLESEFLLTTVGRKVDTSNCRKCRRAVKHVESKTHDTSLFPLGFMFNDTKNLEKQNTSEQKSNERLEPLQDAENLLERTGKESVTFSSVNVDEKIIMQALEHINVNFNKDIIKKHFENINNMQPLFDNVTELIVFNSKRNCDYKKIIKLIILACNDDEVDVKFKQDENISKVTEIVQVRNYDILQTWTIQPDLERLKKLNKKFLQMNVLGKVINLIRHAQQRNTKSVGEFIVIPQYYKTGYICITKK